MPQDKTKHQKLLASKNCCLYYCIIVCAKILPLHCKNFRSQRHLMSSKNQKVGTISKQKCNMKFVFTAELSHFLGTKGSKIIFVQKYFFYFLLQNLVIFCGKKLKKMRNFWKKKKMFFWKFQNFVFFTIKKFRFLEMFLFFSKKFLKFAKFCHFYCFSNNGFRFMQHVTCNWSTNKILKFFGYFWQ
jgi:hypothetical protein